MSEMHVAIGGPSEAAPQGVTAEYTGPGILEILDRVLDQELEIGA